MSGKRTAKDLEKIQAVLLKRKQQLQEEMIRLQSEDFADDQTSQDAADQASSAVLENLKTSLQNNELEEYNMIVKALEMIQDGTYGECVDCGQNISEKRLMSYPNATRCLACQELAEASLY